MPLGEPTGLVVLRGRRLYGHFEADHVHMFTYFYKCIYSYLIRTYVMMLQVCHSFMFQMYPNSFRILPLGLLLIKFSDEQMGTVEYLLPYLLLYGVSRGLWEDMNKKVLSEHLESTTDPASASGGFAMVTFIYDNDNNKKHGGRRS